MATNKMAPTHKQGNLRRDLFSHNFNINDLAFFLSLSLSHTHSFSLTHTHFHSLSLPLNHSLSHSLSQICSFHGRRCEIINSSSYLFEAKTNGLSLRKWFVSEKCICPCCWRIHLSTGSGLNWPHLDWDLQPLINSNMLNKGNPTFWLHTWWQPPSLP